MVDESMKITPAPTDILSARGRGFANLEGNKVFTRLVKKHANAYTDPRAKRKDKSRIIELIREKLSKDNMRFLQKSKHGIWVEMKASDSRLIVSHALRDSKGERSLSTRAQQYIASLSNYDTTARQCISSTVLTQEVTSTSTGKPLASLASHAALPPKCLLSDDKQHDQTVFSKDDGLGVEPDSLISLQELTIAVEPVESCFPSLPVETIDDVFSSIILTEEADALVDDCLLMDLLPMEADAMFELDPVLLKSLARES